MNRKTLFCFLTALIMIFVLAGCGGKNSGGNIDNVQIPDWKPSEIYSDSDIEADRKSTRLNSSHSGESRMPSSA